MRIKRGFRNGIGLGQIMATLLVVLPTLAFSVTFLLSYWNVMQVDYKLKLIANMAADYANSQEDITVFNDANASYRSLASQLCPGNQNITVGTLGDSGQTGVISITVEYTTAATDIYLANKRISTNIQTYSYHDQNMSVTLTCPTL